MKKRFLLLGILLLLFSYPFLWPLIDALWEPKEPDAAAFPKYKAIRVEKDQIYQGIHTNENRPIPRREMATRKRLELRVYFALSEGKGHNHGRSLQSYALPICRFAAQRHYARAPVNLGGVREILAGGKGSVRDDKWWRLQNLLLSSGD